MASWEVSHLCLQMPCLPWYQRQAWQLGPCLCRHPRGWHHPHWKQLRNWGPAERLMPHERCLKHRRACTAVERVTKHTPGICDMHSALGNMQVQMECTPAQARHSHLCKAKLKATGPHGAAAGAAP